MRLIDADELKKAYFNAIEKSSIGEVSILDIIDNAPTVDISEIIGKFRNTAYQNGLITGLHKRTQCRWLYPYSDNVIGKRHIGKSIRVCSNCKESFSNNIPWNASFCPNCGAEVIKNEG